MPMRSALLTTATAPNLTRLIGALLALLALIVIGVGFGSMLVGFVEKPRD
jgi:hypothetical protein